MCSIPDARIILLGQAIDELAEETRTGTRRASAGGTGAEGTGAAGTGAEGRGAEGPDAAAAGAAAARAAAAGTDAGGDGVAQRLARIWAMVAELDPGLAERLPRYAAPSD